MQTTAKTLLLAAFLLIAGLTFAQADSCNMSLVDEWTYYSEWAPAGIEIIDSFLIVITDSFVFTFDLDVDGTIRIIDTLEKRLTGLAVKDSFCYFADGFVSEQLYIYKLTSSGILDSVNTIDTLVGDYMQVQDSFLACCNGFTSNQTIFNIQDPINPNVLSFENLTHEGHFYYFEYPFVFNGGWETRGDPHTSYDHALINIYNASDLDSIYRTCREWGEFGEMYNSSKFTCMTKKDSILYIGGQNKYVNAYIPRSSVNFPTI